MENEKIKYIRLRSNSYTDGDIAIVFIKEDDGVTKSFSIYDHGDTHVVTNGGHFPEWHILKIPRNAAEEMVLDLMKLFDIRGQDAKAPANT